MSPSGQIPRELRGSALAGTLAVISLIIVLAFTMCAVGFGHLTLSTRWGRTQQARNAAESAISLAIATLIANPEVGKAQQPVDDVEVTTEDGLVGRVTYSPDTARKYGVYRSTNNLLNDASVEGSTRIVPQNGVHLVGSCTVDGTVVQMEGVYHVPPYRYAIASSGTVKADYGLIVAKLNGPGDYKTFDQIPKSKLLPAHIASNSSDNLALALGDDSRVTGDAVAAGGIDVSQLAVVMGLLKPHADPVVIPKLDAGPVLNELETRLTPHKIATGSADSAITGFARSDGDLAIYGDLSLEGGFVHVRGNLSVSGGIKGKGALYVDGKTTVAGASEMTTDNMVAVLSKGDVLFAGRSKTESSYRGLVYTEGNFTARNITLMGAFIANGQGAAGDTKLNGSTMAMSNVNLIADDDATKIKLSVVGKLDAPGSAPYTDFPIGESFFFTGKPDPPPGTPGAGFHPGRKTGGGVWFGDTAHGEGPDGVDNFEVTITRRSTDNSWKENTILVKIGNMDEVPLLMARETLRTYVRSQCLARGGTFSDEVFDDSLDHSLFGQSLLSRMMAVPPPPTGGAPSGGGPGGGKTDSVVIDLSFNRFISLGDALRLMLWEQL